MKRLQGPGGACLEKPFPAFPSLVNSVLFQSRGGRKVKQYQDLLRDVLENSSKRGNTRSVFGRIARYDLSQGFPLTTTKKIDFNSIVHELLWLISGDTNIHYLVQNNVNIWNEWPFEQFKKSAEYKNESMQEFAEKIKTNAAFSKRYGDLGPIQGAQWRYFGEFDQFQWVIERIKKFPNDRRLIVNSWNTPQIAKLALPPALLMYQFNVSEDKLSCAMYQRSCDAFTSLPVNVASYALLTTMVAQVTGFKAGEFIHVIGDLHLYENNLEQAREVLGRTPRKMPQLIVNPGVKSIHDFKFKDFELTEYDPYPPIKAPVNVTSPNFELLSA